MEEKRKQVNREAAIRWILGSFFWLVSFGFLVLIANRFWVTLTSYSGAILTAREIDSVVTQRNEVIFADRSALFILALIVGALVVFLFFKFIDPSRSEEAIFLVEDHEYFSKPWFERIDLLRILKLFVIVGLTGLGVWLLTWVAMLILTVLT